jgi:hypothetical protein
METKSVAALCQVQEHLITKHEIEDGILGQRASSVIIAGVSLLIQAWTDVVEHDLKCGSCIIYWYLEA